MMAYPLISKGKHATYHCLVTVKTVCSLFLLTVVASTGIMYLV